VYFSKSTVSVAQLRSSHTKPVVWGWACCWLPRQEGNILFKADIGSKSDYYESDTETVHENPTSHEIYSRIVKLLKKQLPFQTYIGREGGELKPCRGEKHSQGARDWVLSGGRLKTWGEVAAYGIGPKIGGRN